MTKFNERLHGNRNFSSGEDRRDRYYGGDYERDDDRNYRSWDYFPETSYGRSGGYRGEEYGSRGGYEGEYGPRYGRYGESGREDYDYENRRGAIGSRERDYDYDEYDERNRDYDNDADYDYSDEYEYESDRDRDYREGDRRRSGRGFAGMSREERRRIARMGGRTSHGGRGSSGSRGSRSRARDTEGRFTPARSGRRSSSPRSSSRSSTRSGNGRRSRSRSVPR